MITIHSIVPRWSARFSRWYAYDTSGNLIYLDFSFSSGIPEAGKEYEMLGKCMKPAQDGPLFVFLVAAFTERVAPVSGVPSDSEGDIHL